MHCCLCINSKVESSHVLLGFRERMCWDFEREFNWFVFETSIDVHGGIMRERLLLFMRNFQIKSTSVCDDFEAKSTRAEIPGKNSIIFAEILRQSTFWVKN